LTSRLGAAPEPTIPQRISLGYRPFVVCQALLRTVRVVQPPLTFLPLPMVPSWESYDSVGPGEEGYFIALRYIESAQPFMTLSPPVLLPSEGIVTDFYSDGLFLWTNTQHAPDNLASARLGRRLVDRAVTAGGVCPIIEENVLEAALDAARESLASGSARPIHKA